MGGAGGTHLPFRPGPWGPRAASTLLCLAQDRPRSPLPTPKPREATWLVSGGRAETLLYHLLLEALQMSQASKPQEPEAFLSFAQKDVEVTHEQRGFEGTAHPCVRFLSKYCTCMSLPDEFLNKIFFSPAYFIPRIQYEIYITYKIHVNRLHYRQGVQSALPVSSYGLESQNHMQIFGCLGSGRHNPASFKGQLYSL